MFESWEREEESDTMDIYQPIVVNLQRVNESVYAEEEEEEKK